MRRLRDSNAGMSDLRRGKNLEDIVFLLNYGVNVNTDNISLKEYINKHCKILLSKQELREAIFCVLPAGENDIKFVDKIIGDLNTLTTG